VETVVALAVVATALAAVVQATGQQVGSATALRERALAHWVAMNRIAEIQLQEPPPEPGRSRGSERMGRHEWAWAATVSDTPDPSVRRITVEVRALASDPSPLLTRTGFLAASF
jgi:general secretion pathway protein I